MGPGRALAGVRHLLSLGSQLLCPTEATPFQLGCRASWVSMATHTGPSMRGTEGAVNGGQGGDGGDRLGEQGLVLGALGGVVRDLLTFV